MSNDINNQGFTPEELELIAEQQDQMWEEQQEARYPSLLPTDGDQLFRTDVNPGRATAHKRFKPTNTYISGYMKAADLLYQAAQAGAAEAEKRKSEFWPPTTAEHWLVYPMYFLYRHAIELGLKDILRTLLAHGELPKDQERLITESHNVRELWNAAKPGLQTFIDRNLQPNTRAFEGMLDEIQAQDPQAEAGRYDMRNVGTRKKKVLVATFEGLAPLDVNVIHDNAAKMLNYIRWIWSSYEDYELEEEEGRLQMEEWENAQRRIPEGE